MRVYELTDVGRKVLRNVNDGSEEIRILNHISERGQATEDELEVVASKGKLRRLRKSRLIRDVTE